MKATIPIVLFCALAAPRAQQVELPTSWHGTWVGEMTNTGRSGKSSQVPVVFEISPIEGESTLTWRKTYGEGERQLVKDYRLLPREGAPGRFVLDERNGIELDSWLVGGVLFGSFRLGDRCFTSRYELRGEQMTFEITMSIPSGEETGEEGGQGVERRAVTVVQAARLVRKRTDDAVQRAWVEHLAPDQAENRWREIPWRQTLGDGLRDADHEDRPVLLWLMNGHPLGCT